MEEIKKTPQYEQQTIETLIRLNREEGKIGAVYDSYVNSKGSEMYQELMLRDMTIDQLEFLVTAMKNSNSIYSEIYKMYLGPEEQPMLGKLFAEIENTVLNTPLSFGNFTDAMYQKPYWQYFMDEIEDIK